ncbi:MAG: DUF72 domain-containing protein [Deltaproteobacteria bacterium]|nr:DUF72 domain-containing protein [Deltaproteobacteria bacterium]
MRVGVAGWAIPSHVKHRFGDEGSALERYADALTAVEMNSTFYRFHEPATFARWAASVPKDFRFAVKLAGEITHHRRLVACEEPLERFFAGVRELGRKLGPVLIQLPPSLVYDDTLARRFFYQLRALHDGAVVCEPRHPSWFAGTAGRALVEHRVARVAADPSPTAAGSEPGGHDQVTYFRLHGTPQMYHSSYPKPYLHGLATRLTHARGSAPAWVIFDNTAAGAAAANALALVQELRRATPSAATPKSATKPSAKTTAKTPAQAPATPPRRPRRRRA